MSTAKNTPKKRVTIKTAAQARAYLSEFHPDVLAAFADGDSYEVREVCKRCGGSGIYSEFHGVCYECNNQGAGRTFWTRTVTIVEAAKSARRMELSAARAKAAEEKRSAKVEAGKADMLANVKGLAEALEVDHKITRDLREKLDATGSLTLSQVQLARRIKEQVEAQAEDAKSAVSAPVSDDRQTVEGTIVSVKWRDSDYGGAWKVTVRVETGEGHWIAWGTLPGSIEIPRDGRDNELPERLRGATIRFDAKLSAGKEPHFAFFKRPTKATIEGITETEKPAPRCYDERASDADRFAALVRLYWEDREQYDDARAALIASIGEYRYNAIAGEYEEARIGECEAAEARRNDPQI